MKYSRRSFLQFSGATALAAIHPPFLLPSTGTEDQSKIELCHKLAADPLRPQYHLMPAHNWMNDPNGPIFYRGRYHMFHQYNPKAAVWGNMNWAHATSTDMIHWQHEPIAISPTPDGYDRDGVFSGSAMLDNGRPTMIYTGVAPPARGVEPTLKDGTHAWSETQCLAVAQDDDLHTFKKLPEPVIAVPPPGLNVTGFRDPFVWRENNEWLLIVGSGVYGKGGMILLYSSPDLRHWTYLHPLVEGTSNGTKSANPVDTGEMWECPDFFPLGDKHVLIISTEGKERWKVGTYANRRFTPEREGVVDWGSYYAAKTMLDKNGNRVLWGWIPETRPDAALIAAGWAGAMALPRALSLSANDELQTEIAPAARMLRGTHTQVTAADVHKIDNLRIHDLSAEVEVQIASRTEDFYLRLYSDAGDFATLTSENTAGGRQIQVNRITAPLNGAPGKPLRLHFLLDGSVLEVFADGGATTLTARVYQTPSGPLRLKLEGKAKLVSLDVWQLKPISKDRLTGSFCAK